MSFRDQLKVIALRVESHGRDIHNAACDLAYASIVDGSPVTGAPGQRVDTGFLRASWQNIPEAPLRRLIATNVAYAPLFEDGGYDPGGVGRPTGAEHLPGGTNRPGPSTVGGDHSVKLTVAAWPRIVETVTRELADG